MTDIEHIILKKCPECGGELKRMCVIRSDESYSGEEERLYHCEKCLSSWEQTGIQGDLQRKFWG